MVGGPLGYPAHLVCLPPRCVAGSIAGSWSIIFVCPFVRNTCFETVSVSLNCFHHRDGSIIHMFQGIKICHVQPTSDSISKTIQDTDIITVQH